MSARTHEEIAREACGAHRKTDSLFPQDTCRCEEFATALREVAEQARREERERWREWDETVRSDVSHNCYGCWNGVNDHSAACKALVDADAEIERGGANDEPEGGQDVQR